MLSRQFLLGIQMRTTVRWLTCSSISRYSNEINQTNKNKNVIGVHMHRVTDFDRRLLVWVKRYPSIKEVPQEITIECLLTARSRARIKVCNYMIVGTLIGCIIAAICGKKQAERGENWAKMREDWYKEIIAEKDK